jgi:hypothetical protein
VSGTLYWVQSTNTGAGLATAPTKVATGTALKSIMQITIPSTVACRIVEWGCSFDTPASASIINVELFATATILTVGSSGTYAPVEYGTFSGVPALTTCQQAGPGAFTEVTPVAYRPIDLQTIIPPAQYVKQWPLGREPQSNLSTFVRVRVTATVTCGMYAYIIYEE